MQLIQDNGHPHFGRFEQAPTLFNIQEYDNPFLSKAWRRKLRFKKFSFVGIQHQHYTIGLAIVDLAWAGHGFYYCYDRKNDRFIDLHGLQPFARKTQLQTLDRMQNASFFKHYNLQIELKEQGDQRQIQVTRKGATLCQANIKRVQTEPLYMCSPTGIRGWTFTHKSMALKVSGHFYDAEGSQIFFDDKSLASLDDSCGFLRPETEWFWLSSQALINGQKIGINLASGVNESCGNENCLWIDGTIYPLNDVIFQQQGDNLWKIFSLDGAIVLRVTTAWRRYENTNLIITASQFSQWIASIDGRLKTVDQSVTFHHVHAVLEQHYAKW